MALPPSSGEKSAFSHVDPITGPTGVEGRSYEDHLDAALAKIHRTPPTGETLDGVQEMPAAPGASDSVAWGSRRAQLALVALIALMAGAAALWLSFGTRGDGSNAAPAPWVTEPSSTPPAQTPSSVDPATENSDESDGSERGDVTEAGAAAEAGAVAEAGADVPLEADVAGEDPDEAPEPNVVTRRRPGMHGMRGMRGMRTRMGATATEATEMNSGNMESSMSPYFAFD